MTPTAPPDDRAPFGSATNMRFSGHETFAVRYTWIPKAFRYLSHESSSFKDEENVMVELGLGKNMVRSLRFWLEAFGLAKPSDEGLTLTEFSRAILSPGGLDPFLEDPKTLWLLHAQLSMRSQDAICAWDVLVNRWNKGEFSKSEAVRAFRRESERYASKPHSDVTLSQHFDVFIHTYVPTHSRSVGLEETLDCPLKELLLVEPHGERRNGADGRRETVYRFNRDPKPEISAPLFEYVIDQAFAVHKQTESSRTLRELLYGPYGPGQVLRLPEDDLRVRIEDLAESQPRRYKLQMSAVQMVLHRSKPVADESPEERSEIEDRLLGAVYSQVSP
ncbi:MAG: DUF4007 family protein [Deltaproteobacteria bacterium]|nr:DUF4007 family protein [Deltaproteobacteria bacterium]